MVKKHCHLLSHLVREASATLMLMFLLVWDHGTSTHQVDKSVYKMLHNRRISNQTVCVCVL